MGHVMSMKVFSHIRCNLQGLYYRFAHISIELCGSA